MDAYMMDFVFSEREDGGIYDNRNGMDYHIPVSGGIVKEPPMHIVHVSVEMAPIAKVNRFLYPLLIEASSNQRALHFQSTNTSEQHH